MSKPRPNTQKQIGHRREEVLIRLTRGMRYKDIAKELSVDPGTVTRDIQFLQKRSDDYVNQMVRKELTARDIYISDEATKSLKEWLDFK